SHHQTRLTYDLPPIPSPSNLPQHFPQTNQPQSIPPNPHPYRFIIPYPKPKQHITPYQYQPSHFPYLPKNNPPKLQHSPQPLHQYLTYKHPSKT
uniref:D-alanyl-D-alanine carboxypeptidase family protein n=1 Tax=Staphylococcus haemolyticus TaxID=1283 RepID=UPI001642953E